MFWSAELEKIWQLLLDDLAEASHGFFLIEYDRPFTREALLRRLQSEFDQRGWSLVKLSLAAGRLAAQLEQTLQEWPVKASLVRLDDATPQQFRTLNLARERLYALPTVFLFLASRESHTYLLHSAHDLVTWIAPPFSFALPEMGLPNLPPPADQVSPSSTAQIEYYREQIQQALEAGDRSKAFDLLPALADLYLSGDMYDAAYQLCQALAQYHETKADDRQAILFTRRGDIAQGWRILADLQTGHLSSDDRILLQRVLDEGLFLVQKSSAGEIIVDEMGRTKRLSPELLLTLKALSEGVALGSWDVIRLAQILTTHFDREELRMLCFNLDIDYDDLPGEGRANKARELIGYLERRDRISELVEIGKKLRSAVPWEDALKLPEQEFAVGGGSFYILADIQRTLTIARRTRAILEEQVAGYTALTVPANLVVELDQKRREVTELESRLKTLRM